MINSKEYWEEKFNEDLTPRKEQTRFFVDLAINNIPKWISEDIEDNKMSICDAGCAEGIGTYILQKQFYGSQVTGLDFSENAILEAKGKYPECNFITENIKSISQDYDVIFSSNVLEHFYNSKALFRNILKKAQKYCILLLPFREYYTIPEHATYFDFDSFPLELDGYRICFFKTLTMVGEQQKYWFGEQILVIYGKTEHLSGMNLTLKNFYNGYVEERTQIIQDFDTKIKELESECNLLKKSSEEIGAEKQILFSQSQQKISQLVEQSNSYLQELQQVRSQYEQSQMELDQRVGKLQQICEQYDQSQAELNEILEKYSKLKEAYESCEKKLNLLAKSQDSKQYYLNEAYKHICLTQGSRIYRIGLSLKRFIMQCFKEHQKRDYFKWLLCKITKKRNNARLLAEFDCLESSKYFLDLAQKNLFPKFHVLENTKFCAKAMPAVVIFGSVPYYDVGGGQRSAQMAKTFNLLGYRVYYIYGFHCTEENIPDMYIPAIEHEFIDNITCEWFSCIIDKTSIVIFEIPYQKFEPYLDLANDVGCHTVYEHIDNWDSSLGTLFYNEDVFKNFLQKASAITVTARMLGEKIKEHTDREYAYLPNAVNTEIFEPYKDYECPKDLVRGKNKTLLYFGSLWGEWFEWDKINYIAAKCPDCDINLIGDYSGCLERVKSKKKNVHFLGLKKQTELPAYLKYSDIALLPFRNCEIGQYVSPLKIFEYISMNIRVLASELDDIKGYPNVYCSNDKEDWVKEIKKEVEIEDSSKFISENNWFSRCEKIIADTSIVSQTFPSISIIVLNHNNMNVIRRCVETLIAHSQRYHYEIIVVDNCSTDGSYEMLQGYTDSIKLVKNAQNGCSSGRNLGAGKATGKYLCFLDSDQWIISGYWLDSALAILEQNASLGAVAWNAGWFSPGRSDGPIVDYLPNRGIDFAGIWYRTDIAYLATSGFLMKRDLFISIEGFDEFYDPTCFEDTDISLKIRNAGKELAYSPYMGIMHLPHQTTKSGSASHKKLMAKNGKYFMEKWGKINPDLLEYYH